MRSASYTNNPLKFDQNQTMCATLISHFLFLISHHNLIASLRANRFDISKIPSQLRIPMSWDHVHQVWWHSVGNPRWSISNSRACSFYTALNSQLPVGRSLWHAAQKLFGSMRSICVPSFIWIRASMCELYIKISDGVPGGAVEPLCHARVPASAAS